MTGEFKENVDRRIQRTTAQLTQALIDLTLEQGYDTVTVRDITNRAGVGYATFFRHYADKDELLEYTVNATLGELFELLERERSKPPFAVGAVLFQYIQQHRQLCQVMVNNIQVPVLWARFNQLVQETGNELAALPLPLVATPELAANHVVTATVGLIHWWLHNGMPESPEAMGMLYHKLAWLPVFAEPIETGQR